MECSWQLRLNILFLSHPVSFPFLFSLQHPLFSSLFSRETINQIFRALSRDPSLRLVWGRPKISQIGKIPGILRVYLETPGIPEKYPGPCDRLGIVPISSILPQILPQTSSQTQGNSRVSRMEHQTPSVFPGNFRKRKVLGTLCLLFSFLFAGKVYAGLGNLTPRTGELRSAPSWPDQTKSCRFFLFS